MFNYLNNKNNNNNLNNTTNININNNNNNNNHNSANSGEESESSLVFLSAVLRQWIYLKTKVDILVIGEKDVGKSFLINCLLQTTLQKLGSGLEDFFLIPPEEGKKHLIESKIDKIFDSSDFEIKIQNEEMAQNQIREYPTSGRFNSTIYDRHSYLLPQGPFSGIGTKNYSFVYGKIPELIITFSSEEKVRSNLWKLHEFSYIMGNSEGPTIDFEEYLKKKYRQVLNVDRDTSIPLKNVTNPQALPLPPSVSEVLGKTYQFIGQGTNLDLDRIFIREKILEMINQYPFIIEKLLIKMPCGLLNGEKHLILAQSNTVDPTERENTISQLENANLVLVAINENGPSPDLLDLLKKSGILEKMIWNPDQHKVVFIDLSEKNFVEHPNSVSQVLSFTSQEKIDQTRHYLFKQIKQLLVSSEHLSLNSLPKIEEKILNSTSVFFLRPLLYASLEQSGGSITTALQQTNIPSIIACIQNIHLSSNSGSLSDFGEQLRTHSENNDQDNFLKKLDFKENSNKQKNEEGKKSEKSSIFEGISASFLKLINKPRNKMNKEQLINRFKQASQKWKEEWKKSQQSLGYFLQQKAQECNQKMTISQLAFESFVDFVPIFWQKLVIEKVPEKIEDMVSCSFHLLNECSKIVTFPQGSDPQKDKARLKQILKFCKGSAERSIRTKMQQIHEKAMNINIPSIINTTCVESTEVVQINSKAYPRISDKAVRKIYESFSSCIHHAIEITNSIEKHIVDCVRCLTDSPTLRASEIMNFLISSQMQNPEPFLPNLSQTQQNQNQIQQNQFNSNIQNQIQQQTQFNQKQVQTPLSLQKEDNVSHNVPIDFTVGLWEDYLVGRYSNEENYQNQILEHNLTALDVENDNNNQFRSLALLIYRTEEAHSIIRLLLMNEMLANPDQYENLISESLNLQQYVYEKSKENQPADYLILFSFCNFYQVNLLLFSPLFIHPLRINTNHTTETTLALGTLSKTNWQVLVKNDPKSGIQINVEEELRRLKQLHISEEPEFINSGMNNDDCMHVESSDKNQKNQPRSQKRVPKVKTLSEMCISTVCEYIEYMPELEGSLPEDLVQNILSSLIAEEKISSEILQKSLDPSIMHLNLSGWNGLFGPSCITLGKKCPYLENLDISHCSQLSAPDIHAITHGNRSLKKINCEGCHLFDNDCLGYLAQNCPQLTEINITGCSQITDQGLDWLLKSCTNLTHLYFAGCGHISRDGFQHLSKNLKVIDVSECPHLEENMLITVANYCTQLSKIILSGKSVTDQVASAIARGCGSHLITLELTNCTNLTNVGLSDFAKNCKILENLVLQSCRSLKSENFTVIGASLYSTFSINNIAFHRLRKLDLSKCLNVNSNSIINLGNCKDLEILSLHSCDEINESSLIKLAKECQKITEINLSDCKTGVTDSVIIAMGQRCRKLQKVHVYNCHQLTDQSLVALSKCPQMIELNANSCERISDQGLKQFSFGCKKLKTLLIEECNISDEGIRYIARGCPDLERISLAYCKGITNSSLETLSFYCKNLTFLDISYLKNITIDDYTNEVLQRWTRLKQLHLRGMPNFVDQGIEHLTLQSICLSWCKNLTDQALSKITAGCPSLTGIDLAWCGNVSTNGIHNLTQKAPNLHYLNIRGCEKISKLMIKYMSKNGRAIIV